MGCKNWQQLWALALKAPFVALVKALSLQLCSLLLLAVVLMARQDSTRVLLLRGYILCVTMLIFVIKKRQLEGSAVVEGICSMLHSNAKASSNELHIYVHMEACRVADRDLGCPSAVTSALIVLV